MKPLDEKQSKFKKTVVCKPYEYGALKGLILGNFFVNIKITWRRRMDEVKSVMKHFVLHVYPDFVNLRKLGGWGGGGGGAGGGMCQCNYANAAQPFLARCNQI